MRALPIVGMIVLLLAGAARTAWALAIQVLDPDGRPVPDAVVYAAGAAGAVAGGAGMVMTQQGKQFVPYVLAVGTGSRVRFTNEDPINHHVYSFSAPKQFSLKLLKDDRQAPEIVFDKPGIVVLGCNIHDWMLGYIVVLDAARFATTDAGGRAELDIALAPLPVLRVWQPRLGNAPLEVQPVLEGEVAVLRVPRLGADPRPAAVY